MILATPPGIGIGGVPSFSAVFGCSFAIAQRLASSFMPGSMTGTRCARREEAMILTRSSADCCERADHPMIGTRWRKKLGVCRYRKSIEEGQAPTHFRHPEVLAKRASKGDGPNRADSSFEGRCAAASGRRSAWHVWATKNLQLDLTADKNGRSPVMTTKRSFGLDLNPRRRRRRGGQ
jgi:hypothetical protein